MEDNTKFVERGLLGVVKNWIDDDVALANLREGLPMGLSTSTEYRAN